MNKKIDISGVVLKTKRLTLRPWREDDLNDFYAYACVDGVGQMAGWLPHQSIDESKKILTSFILHKKTFALEYQGTAIGSIGIEEYSEENYPELSDLQGRELGYVLSREHWGKGLMPEAVQAVIAYLFDEADLDFILVGHFDWNTRSARVAEKCGFRYVKTVTYETRYDTVETSVESILYHPGKGRPSHFMTGYGYENDEALVQEIYRRFDERTRLNKSKAARVEFLTNVRYIEKYMKPGDRILDVGAGAGEYSLYFAERGYEVSALELADRNVAAFRQRITEKAPVDLIQGNALDLSRYEDASFDAVLVFGPLYHLHEDADKLRCIAEAKRVCRPGGTLFFAFISNDPVFWTMFSDHPDYFTKGAYNKETFRLDDFPFVFHTLPRCRALLQDVHILQEVASDGLSELMQDKLNAMDEENFGQYLRYHFYLCEKPECLGMSNHLLFVCD